MNMLTENRLPVLPLKGTVLMHGGQTELIITGTASALFDRMTRSGQHNAIAVTIKDYDENKNLKEEDFHRTGVFVNITAAIKGDDHIKLKMDLIERAYIKEFFFEDSDVYADYELQPDTPDLSEVEQIEMLDYMKKLAHEIAENFRGSVSMLKILDRIDTVTKMIGFSVQYLSMTIAEKQELLEERSLHKRGIKFIDDLLKQKESVKLQIEMAQKFNENTNNQYRKAMLREQLKEIQKELNEDSPSKKKKDYRQMINEAELPEDIRASALEEVDKLEAQGPNGHEEGMIRTYLDLILALPWFKGPEKAIDLEKARKILDEQHYGLDKVKERIIQHLAVLKLTDKKRGTILLLEGPPGTGKTSLGKSIAEALGRKYVRISLGGVKDEAEIRGHRRTYIGALPGRVISGMKKAGEKDPVFVLDEIDKLMAAYNGDPASALLEVLDPEQNNSFTDHYLDLPYDLSDVFFIATANTVSSIPGPLLDRMEVISISSYTNLEKYHIAVDHLIPEVLEEHGITAEQLQFEESAVNAVISDYTREAGVRGLKKQLAAVARKATEKIAADGPETKISVKAEDLEEILGHKTVRLEDALKHITPGIVTGLAWTPVGGDILFIESTFMPGNGELILTGQLGDVMKESARISVSLIRSRMANQIHHFKFNENDLHIHVPSGSTPKDGPSAGITLFTSLASLLTGKTVDPETAMTGEITLRGSVLPVGGIKEKVLAAHRAGIKKIIMSAENRQDLKDIPCDVRESLEFVFIETIEELIKEALDIELPGPEILYMHSDSTKNVNFSN